jgi:hypothetical protein
MIYCVTCGAKNEDEAKICVSCGRPLVYSGRLDKNVSQPREMCFQGRHEKRDHIGLISFGTFLLLVGIFFTFIPNLASQIESFFQDWQLVQVAENIYFPAPSSSHPSLYFATAEFCIVFGIAQIILLSLEFIQHLPIHRKAETAAGIVFWLGAGNLVYMLSAGSIPWFQFWIVLLILLGISQIARAVVILASRTKSN